MTAFKTLTSRSFLRSVWADKKHQLKNSCFGTDRTTFRYFERYLENQISEIQQRLELGVKPNGLLAIPKEKPAGGYRVICVPTFADRLIQFGLLRLLAPSLGRMGLDNPISFGLAPGVERSVLGARKRACELRISKPWVYKVFIR